MDCSCFLPNRTSDVAVFPDLGKSSGEHSIIITDTNEGQK